MVKKYLTTLPERENKRAFKGLSVKEQVEVVNDWLDTNPLQEWEYWFLGFRVPVNGVTAVQMYRIHRFSDDETGDTAQFHTKAVLGDMQGDWDGDTVNIKWMNEEETKALMEFTRKQNEDGSWGYLIFISQYTVLRNLIYLSVPHKKTYLIQGLLWKVSTHLILMMLLWAL